MLGLEESPKEPKEHSHRRRRPHGECSGVLDQMLLPCRDPYGGALTPGVMCLDLGLQALDKVMRVAPGQWEHSPYAKGKGHEDAPLCSLPLTCRVPRCGEGRVSTQMDGSHEDTPLCSLSLSPSLSLSLPFAASGAEQGERELRPPVRLGSSAPTVMVEPGSLCPFQGVLSRRPGLGDLGWS